MGVMGMGLSRPPVTSDRALHRPPARPIPSSRGCLHRPPVPSDRGCPHRPPPAGFEAAHPPSSAAAAEVSAPPGPGSRRPIVPPRGGAGASRRPRTDPLLRAAGPASELSSGQRGSRQPPSEPETPGQLPYHRSRGRR